MALYGSTIFSDTSTGFKSRVQIVRNNASALNLVSKDWSIYISGTEHDITYASIGKSEEQAGFTDTLIDNIQADIHVVGFYTDQEDPFGTRTNLKVKSVIALNIFPVASNKEKYIEFPKVVILSVNILSSVRGVVGLEFNARSKNFFNLPIYYQ